MIDSERDIEHEGEPFASKQEENVEEDVQQILRKNKRVQTCALVYRVLVVSLQLIKSNYLNWG